MKIKKSQLKALVKEAVQKEVLSTCKEVKHLAECVEVYLEEAPFLKEYKNIKTKKQLVEFFGPFKKLGVSDLEKMADEKPVKQQAAKQQKDAQLISNFVKDVEAARKQLASVKLSDPAGVETVLQQYIGKLIDLYQVLPTVDLDPKAKAQVSKPFAVAAYTLQNLARSLNSAAEDLFSAVPRSSGIYTVGQEAQDVEQAFKASLKTPRQMVGDLFSGRGGGMSIGRGRPPR